MAERVPQTGPTRGFVRARRLWVAALVTSLFAVGGCQPRDVATKRDLARLGAEIKSLRQQQNGASMRDVLQPLTEQLGNFERRASGRDGDWQGLLTEFRAVIQDAAGPELDEQTRQGLVRRLDAVDEQLREDITGLERDRDLVLRALESTVTRLDEFLRAAAPWGPSDLVRSNAKPDVAPAGSATRQLDAVGDGPTGKPLKSAEAKPVAVNRRIDPLGWTLALGAFGALALVAFWTRVRARDEAVIAAQPKHENGVNGGELAQLIGAGTASTGAASEPPHVAAALSPTAASAPTPAEVAASPDRDAVEDYDGLLFAIDEDDDAKPEPAVVTAPEPPSAEAHRRTGTAEAEPLLELPSSMPPVAAELISPTAGSGREEGAAEEEATTRDAGASTEPAPMEPHDSEPGPVGSSVPATGDLRTPRDGPPADEVFAIDFGRDFDSEAKQSAEDHAAEVLDEVAPDSIAEVVTAPATPSPEIEERQPTDDADPTSGTLASRPSGPRWVEHSVATGTPDDVAMQVQTMLSSDPRVLQEPAPTTRVSAEELQVRLVLAPAVDASGWERFKSELEQVASTAPSHGH